MQAAFLARPLNAPCLTDVKAVLIPNMGLSVGAKTVRAFEGQCRKSMRGDDILIQAVLSNADHPEYGVVTIPFPIPRDQFDHCIELVEALEIGNVFIQDCYVDEICSAWPVLTRLEGKVVNLDELDYLAKRLDSFDVGEAAQFQAMTEKLDLTDMKDLINLTFCCQQTTVITDFSDLNAVGRDHYMNTHGGCVSVQELEDLDGEETAILLIDGGGGTVTRYGVVYDNGMKLEQSYDGKHFPAYLYEPPMLMVALTSGQEPEDTQNITWLYLPAAKGQIERAMTRSSIADRSEMRFRFAESMFPDEVDAALDFRYEGIFELNELAQAVDKLSMDDRKKLGAVVTMAEPEYAMQIRHLAENLALFEFAPGVHTPEEYGKFMIQESGHFEYDPNLDEFYDYERYGLQRMEQQSGMFTDRGYISYHGTMSLEVLMMEDPAESYRQEQGFQIGGIRMT